MNKQECIDNIQKAIWDRVSFLQENKDRYNTANDEKQFDEIIKKHQYELDTIRESVQYLKENLK